jgi:predicted nucleotidyltransferase
MSSYVNQLIEKKLLHPPKWLANNVLFEGMSGSVSYGVSNDSSDMDIVGFCMPPKETMFPHLRGEIPGFGTPGERFEQFQKHHVEVPEWGKEFDITIYSVVKFFQLCMENNPNMVDALFLPRRCVLHSTAIYEHVRDNRLMFLHKGSWHKFRGYAYSQLSKIKNQSNSSNPKRQKYVEDFGYDVKFGYHVVRLLLEVEEMMVKHDLTLDQNVPILKAIREGEWPLEKLQQWFEDKEKALEELYHKSTLRYEPDEAAIKRLLMEVIEMHYGSISQSFAKDVGKDTLISELENVIAKFK